MNTNVNICDDTLEAISSVEGRVVTVVFIFSNSRLIYTIKNDLCTRAVANHVVVLTLPTPHLLLVTFTRKGRLCRLQELYLTMAVSVDGFFVTHYTGH
jgi:hypothetical protein